MKIYKKIFVITLCLLMTTSLFGCNDNTIRTNKIKYKKIISTISSGEQVAENEKFILKCDETNHGLVLIDKKSNNIWSTLPQDLKDTNDFKNQQIIQSMIVLDYMKQYDMNYESMYSVDSSNCEVSIEKVDKGIKTTYFFDALKISIPVIYELFDDGLKVSVNLNEIAEGSDFMVGRITLLPMFARVKNYSEEGYIFIPSGSGGISYTSNKTTRSSTENVFGVDYSEAQTRLWTKENVYLPVFGSHEENSSIFAIIDEGAEMALITTSVNDTKLGYSVSYPVFKVRGADKVAKTSNSVIESNIYDEEIADNQISIFYYPMQNEISEYSDMASIYREYLAEKYEYNRETKNDSCFAIKFLGGVLEKKFAFGIPYYDLYSLTTLEEAKNITEEICALTGETPIVQLAGYGKFGLENTEIAGGFEISSRLGSFADVANWQKEYSKSGGVVALDFDVLNFSKSANGFSTYSDVARTTTKQKREQYYYHVALLDSNKSLDSFYLVSRNGINQAVDKLIKTASKNNIKAISLSTLCNTAYSDYGERKYYAKSGMPKQVMDLLSKTSEQNMTFLSNAPFEYAAEMSDYILDLPIQSSKNQVVDNDVPFYQMVFSGRKQIYNIPVNLTVDDNTALLKAVESGSGLSFTISNNYTTKLLNTSQKELYATNYSGLKDRIENLVGEYSEFYNQIKTSNIINHSITASGLRVTEFSNGVVAYVNYSDFEIVESNIVVAAHSYVVKGE